MILGTWWKVYGAGVVGVGVLIIWLASMPVVADWLQWTLESRYPPVHVNDLPSADAIVVLGGAVGAPRPPRVYPDLSGAADRVWHAARLFHAEKAPIVIASGGTLPWRDRRYREAPVMEQLLSEWGVPTDSVHLESRSANTHQNAVHTAHVTSKMGLDRILLVTSALHMRRALATFQQAGVRAIPAATDYRVVHGDRTILHVLPTASALARTTAAIREYVGFLVYDMRGWIARGAETTISPSVGVKNGLARSVFASTLAGSYHQYREQKIVPILTLI